MDIRTLKLFQHLAHSLHFSRTASAMYVSPSTLSRSIQRLEDECGAALLIRDNRTVKLTAIGKQMLGFCDHFLSEWQSLQQTINAQNDALQGELSIFCSVTASFSHLPILLDGFKTEYPQVEIKLITGVAGEAEQRVLSQNVDIAIAVHTPDFPTELMFREIDQIPLVLITPATHKESDWRSIDWRNTPFILPDSGPSYHRVLDWFQRQFLDPIIYAHVAGNEAIVSMVALGCGIGIVPRVVVEHSVVNDRIRALDLPEIEPYRLGVCCLATRCSEAAISAFVSNV